MLITRKSPFTGKITTKDIDVTEEQLLAWQGGMLIQNAMSNLSPDDREFIKTGILPDEWDTLFKEEDDE